MYKCFMTVLISLMFNQLFADGHKIQIMMTVPRTVSTAFERSMMERGDHKVFHEPWNSDYNYRNLMGSAPPEEIVQAGGYKGIKKLLYKHAEQKPVYVKDMIWAIKDEILNDQALLSDPNVVLAILIRDPALSMESFFLKMSEKAPQFLAMEITRWVFCYDALVLLANKYRELHGEWPILVEAEELCEAPATVMQDYCRRAGISYIPESLAWEKKMPEEWDHLKRWHKEAAESEGFFIPKREAKVRFAAVPKKYVPKLEKLYREQKPYYEQLQKIKSQINKSKS